jgi:hypothetical protein
MAFLSNDESGVATTQVTRLLRDESTDNVALLLELIEGGGSNRRIVGYLFGIAAFHRTKVVSERAMKLLRQHASPDTVRQADKLREGNNYHYNEAEYLGKYHNQEFDLFDFLLATRMCHWHRSAAAGSQRGAYASVAHQTLDLSFYPDPVLSPALATLDFVRYITLPAHKQFDLEASLPALLPLPLESVVLENARLETFPVLLFQLPQLRTLTVRRGTYRPRQPMLVPLTNAPYGSATLEKLMIDGYPIEGEQFLGAFPALREAALTRCQLRGFDFLAQSTGLQHLHLRFNLLETLPAFLANLTELRTLDLNGNPFRHIELDLSQLTQLEELDLKISRKQGAVQG